MLAHALFGISGSILYTPATAVVGHWFLKRRGTATGFVSTGVGLGGVIYPIMLNRLFEMIGESQISPCHSSCPDPRSQTLTYIRLPQLDSRGCRHECRPHVTRVLFPQGTSASSTATTDLCSQEAIQGSPVYDDACWILRRHAQVSLADTHTLAKQASTLCLPAQLHFMIRS